jgi:hypothetical protein
MKEMKNYNEFLTEVKENILFFVPNIEGLEVKINKVTKTNVILDGLSIIKKEESVCFSPTIYLNSYYVQYQRGRNFSDILQEIANIYLEHKDNKPSYNIDLDDKENIIINVINRDMNKELLKETPHLIFEDLAITFKFLVSKNADGLGTILLKDKLIGDADLGTLYEKALINTRRLFGINIRTMTEVMSDMLRKEGCNEEIIELMAPEDTLPMYVISNDLGINGAAILLMNDVFKELSDKLSSDLYILPSSIHELICISTKYGNQKDLKEMVTSVNDEQVAIEDRLSDNCYIYKRATNKVELCY